MMILAKVNERIQLFSSGSHLLRAELLHGLIRVGRALLTLGPVLRCYQGILKEARDCSEVKEGLTMKAAGSF